MVGFFAILHGHAHGAEMPTDASGQSYALCFMLATSILHVVGIAIGIRLRRFAQATSSRITQIAGGAMALAGIGILSGYL